MKPSKERVTRDTPVTVGDITRPVREWLDLNDIPMSVFSQRVFVGWDMAAAVTTPVLTRQQAGIRAANKVRFVLSRVGRPSPEFVPGRRKPRADRKRKPSASYGGSNGRIQ